MPLVNHKDKNIRYLIVFSSLINLSSLLLGGVILTYVIDLSNDANTIKHDIVNITDMSLFNNKTIIIDPTWRQFLRSYSDTYDPYLKEIYNNNPFIFCGTYEDLEELYDKLEKIHMECFNLPLTNKENLVFYKHYKSYNF